MSAFASSATALDHFYLPFARVDEEKRQVRALFFTTPRVRGDKWNLKYETLKRAAQRYMEMPCIREMHGPNAAGNALSLHFDDEKQTGEMVLEVVDDAAWNKVLRKVYRGLSLGGVPLLTRGTDIEQFDWIETSLVDRPKDKGALFTDVRRVDDALAGARCIELPEDASDDDVAFARGELEEQLERLEGGLSLERYDAAQPRDDHGMWTIVAGHRISVYGHAITHDHIHAAKKKFGISDEAHAALLKAHDEGHVTTDHHLFRTLSHAEAKAGGLHALTTAHVASGLAHHGIDGSHENRWHSEAHGQAPKIQAGMSIGHALGAHQLQKGDVVHFPSHGESAPIAGIVHKVNPKSIDIASAVGGAQVGVRVKKEHLKRPGFVRRESALHHVEVARYEESEISRGEFDEELQFQAEGIIELARRAGTEDPDGAVNEVMERLLDIAHDEAGSVERVEGRNGWRTQPRDDIGRWTDGGGNINVAHVHHVMKHEGIHEDEHHDEVKRKIEAGELKTREDVLKHIDSLHESRKNGERKEGEGAGKEDGAKEDKPKADAPKDDKGKEKPKKEDGAKPGKTGKASEKEPAHGTEQKPRNFKEHLKHFLKETLHSFLQGVRQGRAAVGRAEEEDILPQLIEQFTDGLEQADEAHFKAALQAACAALGGQSVARLLSSGDVPVRENLEGPGKAALNALREVLEGKSGEFHTDDNDEIRELLQNALGMVKRGEEDESLTANMVPLQRFAEVEGMVQRLEGELSTAQATAQAALSRAETAEGNETLARADVTRLEGEVEKLRATPLTNSAHRYVAGVPLARTYAANDLLTPGGQTPAQQREALEGRKREILDEVKTANAVQRGELAAEISNIDAALHRLR